MRRTWPVLLLAVVSLACSGGEASPAAPAESVPDTATGTGSSGTTTETAVPGEPDNDLPMAQALHCDPLDERACLLPWPNDAFTVPDPSSATGRRLAIQAESTPRNADGIHLDPTDQNRADGFSAMSTVLAFIPRLDLEASGIAPSTDIGASLAPDAPIVLLDATSGERLPYWAQYS